MDEWERPKTLIEVVDYLRTSACVHPHSGKRRMPTQLDDDVFNTAADLLEEMALKKEAA